MSTSTKKFHLSRLSHLSLGQFISSSLTNLQDKGIDLTEDKIIQTLISKLQDSLPLYNDAVRQVKKTSLASQVREADKVRDRDLLALFSHLKAAQHSRNPEKQKAITQVMPQIQALQYMSKLSYEKQSSQIKHLLKILESPDNQTYLKVLVAEEYVSNLKQSQEDFYKLFLSHTRRATISPSTPIRDGLRLQLESTYKTLYSHLTNLVYLEPNSHYKDILVSLNEIRDYYARYPERFEKARKKENLDSQAPQVSAS